QLDALQTGTANFIDGRCRDRVRQARADPRNPCWVLSEAGLEHIAHDDLIDIFPFYPVLFDNAPYHLRSKIGGRNPLETSAKRSYCGTTCICNHYFLHDSPPIWKFRI